MAWCDRHMTWDISVMLLRTWLLVNKTLYCASFHPSSRSSSAAGTLETKKFKAKFKKGCGTINKLKFITFQELMADIVSKFGFLVHSTCTCVAKKFAMVENVQAAS